MGSRIAQNWSTSNAVIGPIHDTRQMTNRPQDKRITDRNIEKVCKITQQQFLREITACSCQSHDGRNASFSNLVELYYAKPIL